MNGGGVCVTGMYRSGVSMVAELLEGRGHGLRGGSGFAALNDELLAHLGGGWDFPPKAPSGWARDDGLRPLRDRAHRLVAECSAAERWGWADPTSSLTLRFWTSIVPSLRTVICVRNPLEVALSLQREHGVSRALGLSLWWTYYRRLLASTRPRQRVVTHFDAHFHRADAVEPVVRFITDVPVGNPDDIGVPDVRADRRHAELAIEDLHEADVPPQLVELYRELCVEAAWTDRRARRSRLVAAPPPVVPERVAPEPVAPASETGDASVADAGAPARGYEDLVARVREVILRTVPPGAPVVVVSKGDGALLELDGRPAWHFPQSPAGGYAGHYPADSADAIAQLEAVRAMGGGYLIFPATATWWLEHYADFRSHLEHHYRLLAHEEDTCLVFDLAPVEATAPVGSDRVASHQRAVQIRDVVESVLPPAAVVAVVTDPEDALVDVAHQMGWHLPLLGDGSPEPMDSGEVNTQVEGWRAGGAEYLLLPPTVPRAAHGYGDLRRCLERGHRLVLSQQHVCTIYELIPPARRRRRSRAQRRAHA